MYYTIHTWMINGMRLAKTDLLVYALIYSFSRDNGGCCWLSLNSIAEAIGNKRRAVINSLNYLMDKGLVKKWGFNEEYKTNQFVAVVPDIYRNEDSAENAPQCKKCTPTSAKNAPNR